MNALLLISLTLPLGASIDDAAMKYESRSTVFTGGQYAEEKFEWRLLKPETIEPGKTYPVVLFLHGAGERGSDNKAQLKFLPDWLASDENRKKHPCFVIAPQCRIGKQWANVKWSDKESTPAPPPSEQIQVALAALEEVLKEFPCDKNRVYLTGLSMGGYGSWDLACRKPELFAAVVPVCGGGDERLAAKLVGLPVWAWHGDADKAVPVERSRKMIEAVKAAGGDPKYTELPGVGHNSWVQAYSGPENCLSWLFEQVRKPKTE